MFEKIVIPMAFGLFVMWPITLALGYILWRNKRQQIGFIKCKRCNHTGLAKGKSVFFQGTKAVCSKCESDDWVTTNSRQK
jgi:hypothetical protein